MKTTKMFHCLDLKNFLMYYFEIIGLIVGPGKVLEFEN